MDIADRIKQVIDKQNITIEALAVQLDEKPTRIRDILRKKQRPPVDFLAAIVELFQVDALWLLTGKQSTNAQVSQDEYIFIPVYDVEVSAGNGKEVFGERCKKYHAFRKRWADYHNFRENDLVIVIAKGDSMIPEIRNGEYLVVNTAKKTVIDGCIFVIRSNNSLLVKSVQMQVNGDILLVSENKTYPDQRVTKSELETGEVEIVGQVVHGSRDFI